MDVLVLAPYLKCFFFFFNSKNKRWRPFESFTYLLEISRKIQLN